MSSTQIIVFYFEALPYIHKNAVPQIRSTAFLNYMSSFEPTNINVIDGKRINNGFMESKNRLVAKFIYNANRFKNFNRTRN